MRDDQIWRLRLGVGDSGNEWAAWVYYEDIDRLAIALTDAYLAAESNGQQQKTRASRMLARAWLRARGNGTETRVKRVVALERHTGAGWVEVAVEFIPPGVRIDKEAVL